ncbi:MAG TPA: hypothetical protein VKA57_14550 [Solirubrobacteraceae bacterium]|nr:hypothetical protein [Solirubrobacteraceae bacterium]
MAEDLIPPPSPAGRPEPESSESAGRIAEGLWSGGEGGARTASAAPPEGEAPAAAARPLAASPYRSRFGFIVGALIGVALAAVGLGTILALKTSEKGAAEGWSDWRPTSDDELGAAKQIAKHVGVKYRLGDADQLVAVQSSGMELADRPLGVALRTAARGGDIELIDGHGVLYTLNGLGKFGSIAGGKPSEERLLLLKREALELALYTFRYADDVDMVVTLLPPPPPKPDEQATAGQLPPVPALFYRPGDLRGELGVPLESTLPALTPRPEQVDLDKPEAKRIDALTRSNSFTATFQQGQDASVFLVLER